MKSYALITGAAGGLGKAFALECAERGWDMFLTDRDSSTLEKLAEGINRLYNIHIVCKSCDLTDDSSRRELWRSEEHTSELQSHSFISYAVFCLKKKKNNTIK